MKKSENSGGRQSGTGEKTEQDSVSGVSERKIYCSARKSDLNAGKECKYYHSFKANNPPRGEGRGTLQIFSEKVI